MSDSERLTVGTRLRQRRKELGLTLPELESRTRVRLAFLQSLEEDRFDGFPGDAYLFGFLKSYAEALGLPAAELMAELRAQLGADSGFTEIPPLVADPFLAQPSRPRLPLRRFVAAFVAVLLLAGFAFLVWRHGPWPSPGTGVRQAPPVTESQPPIPAPAESTAPEPPADSPDDDVSGTAPAVDTPSSLPVETATAAPEMLPAGGGVLRVETRERVALEIRIDDLPPRKYVLAGGSSISWQAEKSLQLQVDRPESIDLWLADQPLDLRGRSELTLRRDAGGGGN
ncbi:MAG: helix-turn-helix domain-containing protein [Trichloromonas sp.]|jgi:transcriptional regulator with XRE-family HTH domain|nr:helix-turn-helix domain-containing protein [Trichloromonas sp.]